MREFLIARFATVRRNLDRVLNHLTEDLIDWAPGEGMPTIGASLFEIVGKEIELLSYAKAGGRYEWVEVEDFGGREKTLVGLRSVLEATRQETLNYVHSLTDDDLESTVQFPTDWWEGLGLAELPLHEVIRNVAMHEWYHTGQLTSYLWSRGDDPTAW
jgi:uncharacterized damage-inducible protein DinB